MIHPNWETDFSDLNFSDPDLGDELKESDNCHFYTVQKKCQKCQTPTFCEVSKSFVTCVYACNIPLVSIKVVATYCIDFSVATNESGTLHKNVILLWDFVF